MTFNAPQDQPSGRHEPWNMSFTMMTATINKHADLRKIDSFTLYEKNSSIIDGYDWCRIKYIGPPAIIPNAHSCKMEFANRVGDQTYVGTKCSSKIYKEREVTNLENYELWEKECFKESFKPYRPEAQIKTINDKNYIYCPNYTISYHHHSAGTPEITDKCPGEGSTRVYTLCS